MPTLKSSFHYEGNVSAFPFDRIELSISFSNLSYTRDTISGNYLRNERDESIKQPIDINASDYLVKLPSLVGTDEASMINFWNALVLDKHDDAVLEELLSVPVVLTVQADSRNVIGEKSYRCILCLNTSGGEFAELKNNTIKQRDSKKELQGPLREQLCKYVSENTILISKSALEGLKKQLQVSLQLLLQAIGHFAVFKNDKLLVPAAEDAGTYFKTLGTGNSKAPAIFRTLLPTLFDFPVSIPSIKTIQVSGVFSIESSSGQDVNASDFEKYRLTLNYVQRSGDRIAPRSLECTKFEPLDNRKDSVKFSFDEFITHHISGSVELTVKSFDGAVVWHKKFNPDSSELQQLQIAVTMVSPRQLSTDNAQKSLQSLKKLYGKLVSLDPKTKLKGRTIVIEAKKVEAETAEVIGSATSDSAGNFSMEYPSGNFTEANARVSQSGSAIKITINKDGLNPDSGGTLSEDFLFLMVSDAAIESEDDDCGCHTNNKVQRLPDQSELIGSEEYTQDIGGGCMNLSTPNRTISEHSFKAVVRTSDPDVANFVLKKRTDGSYALNAETIAWVRPKISYETPIKWHQTGEAVANFSQAVSVSTGHILHYKVVTKADGYSLGDLKYSLPLAPGQKKQIVITDMARILDASETQKVTQAESLGASLVSNRQISDVLTGSFDESISGSSSATNAGVSVGVSSILGTFTGLIGISGGVSHSRSEASQNSSRDMAQAFSEALREGINQSAMSYREMNATVVTSVKENQHYNVTSEVVANHNHCHSLTMMYFEVLRHYAVYQDLASVEECLFIPLLLTEFKRENVNRWRDVLSKRLLPTSKPLQKIPLGIGTSRFSAYEIPRNQLLEGFEALNRLSTGYNYPLGAYNEEKIQYLKGQIAFRVNLPRPKTGYDRIKTFPVTKKSIELSAFFDWISITISWNSVEAKIDEYISVDANYESVAPKDCIRVIKFDRHFMANDSIQRQLWEMYARLLPYNGNVVAMLDTYFKDRLISEWDDIFYNEMAPVIFENILKRISMDHVALDLTSLERYKGGERKIRVNLSGTTNKTRKEFPDNIKMICRPSLESINDDVTMIVEDTRIQYYTENYSDYLFNGYLGQDITDITGVDLYIPENSGELRNPRLEDEKLANKLIDHLNANLEYYNKVLWRNLDSDRRYMLLDGFNIDTYNQAGQFLTSRSLSTVVKNQVIGVAGNSLIMPVAPGYKVSQSFIVENSSEEATSPTIFDHYKPLTPPAPYRISIPTKGVFSEAIMGVCNACEKVEENTSQDWTKFTTDEPTPINPVTAPAPTVTDWKAAWKDLVPPMINIQNAPSLPAPGAGLAGVSDALTKTGVFKDITGLDGNQQNAMQTYLSNQANAKAFAEMTKDMAIHEFNAKHSDKILDSIRNAKELTPDEKAKMVKDHLQQMVNGRADIEMADSANREKQSALETAIKASGEGKTVKMQRTYADGSSEFVHIEGSSNKTVLAEVVGVPQLRQDPATETCWAIAATMMMGWKANMTLTVESVMTKAGPLYLEKFLNGLGLQSEEKPDFIGKLGLSGEDPVGYALKEYINKLKLFGPLWITTDSAIPTGSFAPHAKILVRITGINEIDADTAEFTFINPWTGEEETQPFRDFLNSYEQMVTDNTSGNAFIQLVRFKESRSFPGFSEGSGSQHSASNAPILPTTDWELVKSRLTGIGTQEENDWTSESGSKKVESDPEMLDKLKTYWETVPGVDAESQATASANDVEPWSAAFICYLMRYAGVPNLAGFDFGPRHIIYIVGALRNRENSDVSKPFWLYGRLEMLKEAMPEIGDLICYNRGDSNFSYPSLRAMYWGNNADPVGKTHCNVVIWKYQRNGKTIWQTIGGNISHSVRYVYLSIENDQIYEVDSAGRNPIPAPAIFGVIKLMA